MVYLIIFLVALVLVIIGINKFNYIEEKFSSDYRFLREDTSMTISKVIDDIRDLNCKSYRFNDEIKGIDNTLHELGCRVDQELFDTVEVIMEPINPINFYKLPEKGSPYAAGHDIYWSTANKETNKDGSITIEPGETVKFGTNLNIMITIDNFYLDICSRSGMSINKNLVVINSPARIDSDYRGELLVGLKNLSNESIIIPPQSRIAQCTLHRETNTSFMLGRVVNNTNRGDGGLGHSGEKEIVNN